MALGWLAARATGTWVPLAALAAIGLLLMPAPRIAQQWERAVVLRFGRFVGLRGPGLFWVIPFVDQLRFTSTARSDPSSAPSVSG